MTTEAFGCSACLRWSDVPRKMRPVDEFMPQLIDIPMSSRADPATTSQQHVPIDSEKHTGTTSATRCSVSKSLRRQWLSCHCVQSPMRRMTLSRASTRAVATPLFRARVRVPDRRSAASLTRANAADLDAHMQSDMLTEFKCDDNDAPTASVSPARQRPRARHQQ